MHTRIAAVATVAAAVILAASARAQTEPERSAVLDQLEVARFLADEGITLDDYRLAAAIASRLEAEGLTAEDLPPRESVVEAATARRGTWNFLLVLLGVIGAFALIYWRPPARRKTRTATASDTPPPASPAPEGGA